MSSDVAASEGSGRDKAGMPADVFASQPGGAWRAAWDSSPALVTLTWGPEQRLAYQNRASEALFGARQLGLPLEEAFPELGGGRSEPLDRVLRTGETIQMPPHLIDIPDVKGDEVALSYVLTPFGDPPVGVVITAIDVTAHLRAQEQAARTQLLADITGAMTAASDAAAGLQALTDLLVPSVADLAAVYVVPDEQLDDGPPLPPEVLTLSAELRALGPPPPPAGNRGPSPYIPMLRSGTSLLISIEGETVESVAREPQTAAWLRAAGGRNIAAVPLVVAGTLTGAMVLMAAGPRRPYQDVDLPFLEDLAARAGAAINALRTGRRLRDTAVDLQRALLPPPPAGMAGMTAAARYVAGAPDVEVGGDWWDLHDTGTGQVAVGIGDVSGRGIPAAAVMGQARAVMRAAGHARMAPVDVLTLLDAQLSDALVIPEQSTSRTPTIIGRSPVRFATACYGIVDVGKLTLRLANAGHLPMLLRSPDGNVRRVQAPPGAPLGVGAGGYVEVTEDLVPGDTLVLFTDGLVESRTRDVDDGLALLSNVLVRDGGADVESVADAIVDSMKGGPVEYADDVALVVLRIDSRVG